MVAKDETKFRVLHSSVGDAQAGDIVTFLPGIDTERLLALGAIEEVKGRDPDVDTDAEVEQSQASQQTAEAVAGPGTVQKATTDSGSTSGKK